MDTYNATRVLLYSPSNNTIRITMSPPVGQAVLGSVIYMFYDMTLLIMGRPFDIADNLTACLFAKFSDGVVGHSRMYFYIERFSTAQIMF